MSQMTKRALAASLKKMLLKKPLNQITILDITSDCGVNRMTFYYHFQDIYDLVEWTCEEEARQALDGKKTYHSWQEGFRNIFEAVRENRPFILNVYHSVSREQIERYLYRLVYELIRGVVEEQGAGMTVREEDRQFLCNFYKYAFVGILLNWIQSDMKEDPQEIVDRLSLLIQGDISRALERFRMDPPHQKSLSD